MAYLKAELSSGLLKDYFFSEHLAMWNGAHDLPREESEWQYIYTEEYQILKMIFNKIPHADPILCLRK